MADKTQVGGTHYLDLDIQPWDADQAWSTPDQFQGFLLLTAINYLARFNSTAPGKGGLLDVQKAIHTLQKLEQVMIERSSSEAAK